MQTWLKKQLIDSVEEICEEVLSIMIMPTVVLIKIQTKDNDKPTIYRLKDVFKPDVNDFTIDLLKTKYSDLCS